MCHLGSHTCPPIRTVTGPDGREAREEVGWVAKEVDLMEAVEAVGWVAKVV